MVSGKVPLRLCTRGWCVNLAHKLCMDVARNSPAREPKGSPCFVSRQTPFVATGVSVADNTIKRNPALGAAHKLLLEGSPNFICVALFGFETSAWTAASVALTRYTSAFLVEIWRGCVVAVPKGQWEAAQSLALNFGEQLRCVVLPQATRTAIAPPVGYPRAGARNGETPELQQFLSSIH